MLGDQPDQFGPYNDFGVNEVVVITGISGAEGFETCSEKSAASRAPVFIALMQRFRYYAAKKRAAFAVSMQFRSGDAFLTPAQCKMARAGLGIGIRELAEQARVSTNTVSRFEAGEELKGRTVAALQGALEAAGVIFIEENGDGPGVRLKRRNVKI